MPIEWGGLDPYELKFESEDDSYEGDGIINEEVNGVENNNDSSQVNLNLAESKKVKKVTTCGLLKFMCELRELHG